MAINTMQIIGIETLYTLLIVIPCFIIYLKTKKLYTFSNYKGLKYFSNAFLFFAVGFILRYAVMLNKIFSGELYATIQRFDLLLIFMEFFLILPGILLLYALVWKKFENEKYTKKPINMPLLIMFTVSGILAIGDFLLQSLILLYASQILMFSTASIISYNKYREKKQHFKQFYFITMVLFLIVSVTNFIAQYTIDKFPIIRFYAYTITIIVIFLFLYITNKLIKQNLNK